MHARDLEQDVRLQLLLVESVFYEVANADDALELVVIDHRQVPVPTELLDMLDMIYNLRQRKGRQRNERLWLWSRMTAWRKMQELFGSAGIKGPQASPKGLRHGFGVNAVNKGIALNMVQKWLGHAAMTTTAIYANAVGEEEQSIAARMWS